MFEECGQLAKVFQEGGFVRSAGVSVWPRRMLDKGAVPLRLHQEAQFPSSCLLPGEPIGRKNYSLSQMGKPKAQGSNVALIGLQRPHDI